MSRLKTSKFSLTGIVPFFNEEITLEESINKLSRIDIVSEIILVDDYSTDNSKYIGEKLASRNKKIKLLKTPINMGKGGAIQYGLKEVTTSHVIIHDADLEYDPSDIYDLFKNLTSSNLLILGSRYLKSKNLHSQNMNYLLDKIERISTFIFNKLNKTNLTDVGSCYKMMPTNFLINNKFSEQGFFIELEFLTKFINQGGEILEVPINYFGRKKFEGKKNNIFIMFEFLFKVFYISKREKKYSKF